MDRSDDELMERIQQRDADAFEQLYTRYREPIRRHLLQILHSDDAASDVLQEVFVRIWTHADRWSRQGRFKAWLFRVATNRAISELRTLRTRREQPLQRSVTPPAQEQVTPAWSIEAEALGPEAMVGAAEERSRYLSLVERLPAGQRIVFRMAYEAEMDLREIAETLGIPEGTVKSRLFYARRWLALAYARRDREEENPR